MCIAYRLCSGETANETDLVQCPRLSLLVGILFHESYTHSKYTSIVSIPHSPGDRRRSSVVRVSELKPKDPGFDPLVGQGEEQFFCPCQSTFVQTCLCSTPLPVDSCADLFVLDSLPVNSCADLFVLDSPSSQLLCRLVCARLPFPFVCRACTQIYVQYVKDAFRTCQDE